MITVKSKDFRAKVGKLFDVLVGEQELARGIYLAVDGPVAMRLDKQSDCVVIEFAGDYKPKLRINLPILSLKFTKIEKVTIYKTRAVINLANFPDIELVEE